MGESQGANTSTAAIASVQEPSAAEQGGDITLSQHSLAVGNAPEVGPNSNSELSSLSIPSQAREQNRIVLSEDTTQLARSLNDRLQESNGSLDRGNLEILGILVATDLRQSDSVQELFALGIT
ncbi:MAG: hypothetical protein D6780_06160, partial [Candidatus Dadabacteria bacterium]